MLTKLIVIALALVVPALGHSLPYIIGGTPVSSATKYPWQGSLQSSRGSHSCGCALISSTWAVTAAHCVGSSARNYRIRFGSVFHRSGGQYVTPIQSIQHERYGSGVGSFPNDIAVMNFPALRLSSTVSPIKMANSEQAGNDDCHISGWGYTSTGGGGTIPSQLQEAKINVYTNSECKESWGSSINSGHVCIGDNFAGRGSCNGDSGGPLVCKVSGSYQLIGVTSWGINGCFTFYPSVYSRISYFRSWVTGKTGVN